MREREAARVAKGEEQAALGVATAAGQVEAAVVAKAVASRMAMSYV